MSVVAGVSLLDGVLIGADCRMTFSLPARKTYRDTVQKIIAIGPYTVIGFVGSVPLAAKLLKGMVDARGDRKDALEFKEWLPRYFRHAYKKLKATDRVDFMVASVLPSRRNVVPKAAIASAVINAVNARRNSGGNVISRTFLEAVNVPYPNVYVEGSGQGHLYTILSPDFAVRTYAPMQAVAIGSGQAMREQILQVADQIHFGTILDHPEVTWLGRSLQSYLSESGDLTVGAMFPMMKITARRGIVPFGRKTVELKANGKAFELAAEGNRWVLRNLTTGEKVELLLPWEIDHREWSDKRFDGLRPTLMPK
jgi:hypothetical protein